MATLLQEQQRADVTGLFLAYFARAPEYEAMEWYLDTYASLLAAHGNQPNAQNMALAELSAAVYVGGVESGELPQRDLTPPVAIDLLYRNLLGREPDPAGADYWLRQVESGAMPLAELPLAMLNAGLQQGGRDSAYLQNRLAVAEEFSQSPNSNPSMLAWLKYNAAQVIQGVSENPDTVFVGIDKLAVVLAPDGTWSDIILTGAPANLGAEVGENAWFDMNVDTSNAETLGATGGTLTVSGAGIFYYDNNDGWNVAANDWSQNDNGKFHFMDATQLTGHLILGWVGDGEHDPGIYYGGLSPRVSETVALATSKADIVIAIDFQGQGATSSSQVGLMDIILGFDPNAGMQLVGGHEPGQVYSTMFFELPEQAYTRETALQEAARAYGDSGADVLYFHYVSNTYLYADTNGNQVADASDFLLALTGVQDVAFGSQLQDTGWEA